MDIDKKNRENISALADGELPSVEAKVVMVALEGADGKAAWSIYHRIGDELRALPSPDLGAGFAARLAARLSDEPAPKRRAADAGKKPAPVGTTEL